MRTLSVIVTKILMLLTVILYVAIVLFAVVLLALVQLRSAGEEAFDVWKLNYDANVKTIGAQEEKLRETQVQQMGDQNELLSDKHCLKFYDKKGNLQYTLIDEATKQDASTAIRNRTVEKLKGDPYCVARGFTGLQWDIEYADGKVQQDSRDIDGLEKSLLALRNRVDDLTKGHENFVALSLFEEKLYWKRLAELPYDLVVLLLVMTMGVIGGVLRILRDYGSPHIQNPSPKDYALIPSIGAVVAIGGYVLAKTGLLLLSSTRGETSLSPYMVSLVGIISGLLSKEVIETIAARGRNILQRSAQGGPQGSGQTGGDINAAAPNGASGGQKGASS